MCARIENIDVEAACIEAQKKDILYHLSKQFGHNTKEKLLSYVDNTGFFAVHVKQTVYVNLRAYLDRQVKKGALIKTKCGRGSYVGYVFPRAILEILIDEVIREKEGVVHG